MSDLANKAIFLSYASQDAEAAKCICEALRSVGVEVWFDQSELVGGDQWDAKIRGQISACALFLPVISAATQARREGYFRLEWKLAAQRTHMMSERTAFLLPIIIDATREAEADVPGEFRAVQFTKLPGGETPEKFCARVNKLLGGSELEAGRLRPAQRDEGVASPKKKSRPGLVSMILGLAAIAALAVWQPWRSAVSRPTVVAPAAPSEVARVRARIIPDQWQKGDLEAISPTLDRLIQTNPEDSDAWALQSLTHSLQVVRNIDSGTKPLEVGRAAAERALRLAPNSPLAEIALGMHLVAMISRGGDPQAGRPHVARGVAALPPDAITRYADLVSIWAGYNAEGPERSAKTWLAAEPGASFPAWILAQYYVTQRRPDDAEKWAAAAAADRNITGTRALYTLFESSYYLRADLAAAKDALARVPAGGHLVHRVVHARWLLAMAERNWDEALQELARVPEPMLYDRTYHGPRSLLAGLAHQRAGRADAALVQFHEAERLLKAELASDTDNEELHLVLALTLACAGRAAEARSELALVEPLLKGRAPSVYWGALAVSIAQTYGTIGDFHNLALWLRKLLVESSGFPFTPASLRLDPRFTGMLDAPEIQGLLKEFAALDQPVTQKTEDGVQNPAIRPVVDAKSVAVLAFANLSDDKANEYFSDGISEELLNVLAKVPGLKVSARTSAFYFKGKQVPMAEIAQQLGVAYVVEGSVRKQGDKVRITAQLIKAADGFHVWSDTFTRDLKDIFAVQDEIAGIIAKNLELKMGVGSSESRREVNPEAHRLMLEGRYFLTPRTSAGFDQAERAFTQALKIDPQFAQAQAGLATTTALRGRYRLLDGVGRVEEFDQLALAQSRLALQMDSTLAEPHAAMGFVYTDNRQLGDAEQEFQLAFAANPNYATAHHWHSHVLASEGRLDLALKEIARAEALDPVSFIILFIHGFYLHDARQYAEALAMFDRAAALRNESFLPLESERARMLFELGRKEEAMVAARKVLQDTRLIASGWYAAGEALQVLRLGGAADEAARLGESLLPLMPAGSYQRGYALCALGKFTEGLPQLSHMPDIVQSRLYWHPMFDSVRDTPAFQQLIVKFNCVPEYKVARETLARMVKEPGTKP